MCTKYSLNSFIANLQKISLWMAAPWREPHAAQGWDAGVLGVAPLCVSRQVSSVRSYRMQALKPFRLFLPGILKHQMIIKLPFSVLLQLVYFYLTS